ncbi:hypothetical protein ABTW96_32795 [Nocardia beijingensis]|uniref:hypothetical protein n=1 Tax=Nocardia beijingensis TaxID=95162 RepID=UPI00332802CD
MLTHHWCPAGDHLRHRNLHPQLRPDHRRIRLAAARDNLPSRARAELDMLHRMAAGLPDQDIADRHTDNRHQITVWPEEIANFPEDLATQNLRM